MRRTHLGLVCLLLACTFGLEGAAPEGGPKGSSLVRVGDVSVAIEDVYLLFFQHIKTLDATADEFDAKGLRGIEFRNYYRDLLCLSDSECMNLKAVAQNCISSIALEDKDSNEFIERTRTDFRRNPAAGVGEVHRQAIRIANKRIMSIASQVAILKTLVSAKAFQRIETHVRQEFTKDLFAKALTTEAQEMK